MDFFLIILVIISICGCSLSTNNPKYLHRDTTTAVKGIFAIIILISHTGQYITPPHYSSAIDSGNIIYLLNCNNLTYATLDFIGQLMVVMFLFYSGYGIMESYKRKKNDYLNRFIRKRIFKTLIHFDIAVFLFAIIALIFNHQYSLSEWALCLTGWTSIGNIRFDAGAMG